MAKSEFILVSDYLSLSTHIMADTTTTDDELVHIIYDGDRPPDKDRRFWIIFFSISYIICLILTIMGTYIVVNSNHHNYNIGALFIMLFGGTIVIMLSVAQIMMWTHNYTHIRRKITN